MPWIRSPISSLLQIQQFIWYFILLLLHLSLIYSVSDNGISDSPVCAHCHCIVDRNALIVHVFYVV
jgi:hypothetical protein